MSNHVVFGSLTSNKIINNHYFIRRSVLTSYASILGQNIRFYCQIGCPFSRPDFRVESTHPTLHIQLSSKKYQLWNPTVDQDFWPDLDVNDVIFYSFITKSIILDFILQFLNFYNRARERV